MTFNETSTGFILQTEGSTYEMTWVGDMLKVTGDGVCYFLAETARGLEQIQCVTNIATLIMPQ